MKVLQDNRGFAFPFRVVCRDCQSVLEVESCDVRPAKAIGPDGASYEISCPLCGTTTNIKTAERLPA